MKKLLIALMLMCSSALGMHYSRMVEAVTTPEQKAEEARIRAQESAQAATRTLQNLLKKFKHLPNEDPEYKKQKLNEQLPTIRALLAKHANPDAVGYFEDTILIEACLWNSIPVAQLMINSNANVNLNIQGGYTPSMVAAVQGHSEILRLLIRAGADLDVQHESGLTALMLAAGLGHNEVTQILIKAGSDINAKNNDGYTALDIAEQKGYRNIIKLLSQPEKLR